MRLINADALIAEIECGLWDWETVDGITASTVLRQTISDIQNAPTIEDRKTGKWYAIGNSCLATCKCGYFTERYSAYNYCPNCGADMRGREDND